VREVRAALTRVQNLDTLGRGGLFFYSHLHDQMRFARDYVEARVEAGDTPAQVAC
jgi:hypothetical protein